MPHQMTIPGEEIAIFCISMTKIIFRISLLFSGKWDYIFYVSGFGEFHFKSQWSRLEQEVKMKKAEYRIFYAEDNTVKLLAVSRAMKSMGYNIEKSGSNLEDALKEVIRARDEGEPYDILMTDMNYPLKNGGTSTNEAGPTFISKVKEHGISAPVIEISSENYVVPGAFKCVWYVESRNWENDLEEALLEASAICQRTNG